MMITTLLIANRGEIACRIMRTCRRLGIRTVAVYSSADAQARHVAEADTAVHIGASPPAESYLDGAKIIAAAQLTGAQAIHPGFGFLAENADFAQACADAGLIFVGPTAEAMAAMGNKRAAKLLVEQAGLPTVPGYSGDDQSEATLLAQAEAIGYPLMVKAADGGGGKGMRLVHASADLPAALASARREALQAFGAEELILEKALIKPRHIEIQVFGDTQGNLIHLGERECSIQRRHQKVIEEAPAFGLTAELRAEMGATAVAIARAIQYSNAGTVEFLLDGNGRYYFLEMNTRIQVEHPVTEMVTGLDLVEWQIRVAEGEALPIGQDEVTLTGHAIEARVYAENPANDFLPVTGDVWLWSAPSGEGVRVDSGLNEFLTQRGKGAKEQRKESEKALRSPRSLRLNDPQDRISIYYDPMVAKVVAYGGDRKTAVRRLHYALSQTKLLGLTTNLAYLQAVLRHEAFVDGELHTDFLADHFSDWQDDGGDVVLALIAVTITQFEQEPQLESNAGYWRNSPNRPLIYKYADQPDVYLSLVAGGWRLEISGETYSVLSTQHSALVVNGRHQPITLAQHDATWWVQTPAGVVVLESVPLLPKPEAMASAGGSLRAPMPGVVLEVLVEVGQTVAKGQPLLKLEAMKMEHTIRSGGDGVVAAIYFTAGEQVEAEAQLLKIGD